MKRINKKNPINISLSQDEGIVLFELLEELINRSLIKRNSDKRIVWDLICEIEKQSDLMINNPNYKEQLKKARETLAKTVT